MMTGSAVARVLVSVVLVCLLLATVTDLTRRIIPNTVVLVVLVCGLGLQAMSGPAVLLLSTLIATATLAVLSLLGKYSLLGWGDVKLIAAVTLIVPPNHVEGLIFAIVLAGGLLGCFYLGFRFVLRNTPVPVRSTGRTFALGRLARRESARIRANEPMPYAFAILGGVAFGLAVR